MSNWGWVAECWGWARWQVHSSVGLNRLWRLRQGPGRCKSISHMPVGVAADARWGPHKCISCEAGVRQGGQEGAAVEHLHESRAMWLGVGSGTARPGSPAAAAAGAVRPDTCGCKLACDGIPLSAVSEEWEPTHGCASAPSCPPLKCSAHLNLLTVVAIHCRDEGGPFCGDWGWHCVRR